jgi:uncharacterized protein (TIRG00374 family)
MDGRPAGQPQAAAVTVDGHRELQAGGRCGQAARARSVALRILLGLAAGALLLLAFFRLIDLGQVYRDLTHFSIAFGCLSAVAFLGAYAVRALRWRWFLRPSRVSVGRAITIYQVATFLNWLLPVQVGELAKSLLLQRSDGIPVSRSFATVGMDKIMDLLPAVVLLALLPVAGLRLTSLLWTVLILALTALVASCAVLILATWKRERTLAVLTHSRLARVCPRRIRDRAGPAITLFVDTLAALVRQPRALLIGTAYTAAAASLDALSCGFAFRAVGVAAGWAIVFYGCTFMNLTFILPTPPAHVGFTEVIGLLVFSGLLGVNRSAVAAMAVFAHPLDGILLTVTAVAGLGRLGLSLKSGLRLVRPREE